MKSIRLLPALALSGALFALAAYAVNGTWTNLNGGSWTNAANWSGEVIAAGQDRLADLASGHAGGRTAQCLKNDSGINRTPLNSIRG